MLFRLLLLKINRQPEFLKKIKLLKDEDCPKNPLKDLSFPHLNVQSWYSQTPDLLFHDCKPCITKLSGITAEANNSDVCEILSKTCYFVNSQWLMSEENCLDKFYFGLSSNAGGRDLYACNECKINLCLSVLYKEFNCLGKSYVLNRNT